jgi:hypothetical protein
MSQKPKAALNAVKFWSSRVANSGKKGASRVGRNPHGQVERDERQKDATSPGEMVT